MAYVVDNELYDEHGNLLGKFSGHWPAVAAMIRINEPRFRSLGGDKETDLDIEKEIKLITIKLPIE